MLAIGAAAYIAVPFIAFEYDWFLDMPGVEGWHELFKTASDSDLEIALLCTGLTLAYVFGRKIASGTSAKIGSSMNRPISQKLVVLLSIGLWCIWVVATITGRNSFFQGYFIEYDTGLVGNLATVNLVALAAVMNSRQYNVKGIGYILLCILLFINSIALLSLGGRLYVIIPFVAIVLQSLSSIKSTKSRIHLFVGVAAVVAILMLVGVFRIDADFSLRFLAFIALAEGIFTSTSLGSSVRHNVFPILSMCHIIFLAPS